MTRGEPANYPCLGRLSIAQIPSFITLSSLDSLWLDLCGILLFPVQYGVSEPPTRGFFQPHLHFEGALMDVLFHVCFKLDRCLPKPKFHVKAE